MNTLVGISPDGLYIFPVNVGSKKECLKLVNVAIILIPTKKKKK